MHSLPTSAEPLDAILLPAVAEEELAAEIVEDSPAEAARGENGPAAVPLDAAPPHAAGGPAAEGSLPPVRIYDAEPIVEQIAVVDERSLPFWLFHNLCSALEWLFGLFSLLVGLSVLAVVPLLQLMSLGYLLEVSGRIARTGRVSEAFIGVRKAARIGSLLLGTWLMLWPLRMISEMWYSAQLIDRTSWITGAWRLALLACFAVTCGHIVLAWFCGGKLRHFFWPLLAIPSLFLWALRALVSTQVLSPIGGPIRRSFSQRLLADIGRHRPLTDWFPPAILWGAVRRGRMYAHARDAVCDFLVSLRLPYYFWLGARGFAGTVAWLFVPVMLLIGTTKLPEGPGGLSFVLGFFSLSLVLLYLPFMQAHFAAENRFVAMFEVGQVRRQFGRAPIAFLIALFFTLLFALPLYLFKIEVPPRQDSWWIAELSFVSITSLIFVAFIWPTRFLAGWALARARKREKKRFFLVRWGVRFLELPIVALYVLMVYVSQYTSWYGAWSLFEQHAFLVPAPFLSI